MTAPTTSAYSTTVPKSGTTNVDALLSGQKWGYALSSNSAPLTISYSFPWINGLNAVFYGLAGAAYSKSGEQNATERFGLNDTQQTAATLALSAWSNVANVDFQLVSETTTNVGDVRFAFTSVSGLSNYWGWASYPNGYWPSAGDVWINSQHGSDTNWVVGSSNFKSLMHEIGHVLGLKHPFEGEVVLSSNFDNRTNTIMSYTGIKDVYPNAGYINGQYSWLTYYIRAETPMVFDIAAIQYIYGANNNYKTGDDTYTFDPTKPFFKTIWDAGGKDTISISNFSIACIVDLTPGNYSSLSYPSPSNNGGATVTYDGTNNLGIAFNCIIENAIGSSGNDKLIGNSANNSLDGGPGNDVMYGGLGNDFFDWDSSKRSGNDTFYGGMGDDVFVLDSTSESVIEYANEGNDSIWVDFSYSISSIANVENLFGNGINSLSLIGNNAANSFKGGKGNDSIDGSSGTDYVFYADNFADCSITSNGLNYTVNTKTEGTDSVTNIEFLKFLDQTIDSTRLNSLPVNITGTALKDTFTSTYSNEYIDGGEGIDTVIYSGAKSAYSITNNMSSVTVSSGVNGLGTLKNIERIQFSDRTVALDISGTAGQAYRVYQAAFNRTPDNGGLKYWIGLMDGGYTLAGVASGFIASTEFKTLYGSNPTNELFVSKLYDNVLHRTPDEGGYNYWVGLLNTNKIDSISTLINFSESTENQAGVIGVIQNGIDLLN